MHQLRIEGGCKLNKNKRTSAQKKSDSVLSCKKFQGFVLIYLLCWLCVGTKTIYHLEFPLNILCNTSSVGSWGGDNLGQLPSPNLCGAPLNGAPLP